MKPVFIEFTDHEGKVIKRFSTCSLKTGMMDSIFDIAERSDELESGKLEIRQAKEFYKDLKAIIVSVFHGQFTYDELNEGVEQTQLIKVFTELCSRLNGEIAKN
jgi:hypothetical protein